MLPTFYVEVLKRPVSVNIGRFIFPDFKHYST